MPESMVGSTSPAITPRSWRRDPLLILLALAALLVVGWLVAGTSDALGRLRLFWFVQPVSDVVFGTLALRLWRAPGLPKSSRRFFLALAFAGAVFALGDSSQFWTVNLPGATAGTQPTAVESGCFAVGVLAILLALLSYPTAVVGARQRFRFVLDAGTVILSGLSLIWATSVHQTGDLATALITGGMLMAVVFAGFKVQNSGNAPLTGLALVLCMLATGLQALAMLLTWLSGSVPAALTALSVLPNFLIPLGLRFQQLNSSRHRPVGPARRDRFRVALWLPWAAVAVAGAALVLTLVGRGDLNTWGTVIVVLVLAAVVVARQVDALIDSTKLAENLQGKERWVNELLRHSTDVTAVMNKAGVITWVSPGIRAILGRSQETIVGMDSAKIIHPDDIAEFGRLVSQVFGQPGETASLTARVQHGDQSWRWMEVTMTNLLDDPVVQGLVCNGRDVTDARGLQERLRHEATHDPLTSLPNRALFAERLGAVAGATAALLLIDLDGFKAVNDTHGHHAGDALLVAIAERLRRCVRPGDTPARLGGDEFAVVLPAAGRSDAEHVAARLTALLTDPVALDGVLVPLRASIGIATSDAVDPDQLLREADSAMYATKRAQKHDGRRALAG